MPDEALRGLERVAKDDQTALTRLTAERLRRNEGVVFVWIGDTHPRLQSPSNPQGPAGSIEVMLRGFMTAGEVPFGTPPGMLIPVIDKRAWVLACLNITDAVFGRFQSNGRDLTGPMLLELHTKRLGSGFTITAGVTIAQKPVDERAPETPGLKCSSCGHTVTEKVVWRDCGSQVPVTLLTKSELEGRVGKFYCCQGHAPRPDWYEPHHH